MQKFVNMLDSTLNELKNQFIGLRHFLLKIVSISMHCYFNAIFGHDCLN